MSIWDRATVISLAALALLSLAIFQDYCISTDEPTTDSHGRMVIAYYASGSADRRAQIDEVNNQYGYLFDVTANLLAPLLPFPHYDSRHLINALVGILGILGCWRLSRRLFGPRDGFLSALLLTLIPSYFGHMFINPKDIPFAAGYIWSLYFLVRCLEALPKVPLREAVKFGTAWGLTLAIKAPAAIIGLYLVTGVAAILWLRVKRGLPINLSAFVLQSGLSILPGLVIAYMIMLACWPWAQLHPIGNPLRALETFAHFPQWKGSITLDGIRYAYDEIPRSYLPLYFWVKLPEFVLLGVASTPILMLAWWRRSSKHKPEQTLFIGLVAFAVLLPVLLQIIMNSLVYDGIRHFLFILPPLAVLLGPLLGAGIDYLARHTTILGYAAAAMATLYLAYHVSLLIRLHPYQQVYFNQLAGGLPSAVHRFDMELWQTSSREAVSQLLAYLSRKANDDGPVIVAVCGSQAQHYFTKRLRMAKPGEWPDFTIILGPLKTAGECLEYERGAREIFVVSRLGVPLATIKRIPPPE